MRRRSSRCLNEEEKGRASDSDGVDGSMDRWIDDGLMIRFGSDLWIIVYLFICFLFITISSLSICLFVYMFIWTSLF